MVWHTLWCTYSMCECSYMHVRYFATEIRGLTQSLVEKRSTRNTRTVQLTDVRHSPMWRSDSGATGIQILYRRPRRDSKLAGLNLHVVWISQTSGNSQVKFTHHYVFL